MKDAAMINNPITMYVQVLTFRDSDLLSDSFTIVFYLLLFQFYDLDTLKTFKVMHHGIDLKAKNDMQLLRLT